jgi:rubrerythrin
VPGRHAGKLKGERMDPVENIIMSLYARQPEEKEVSVFERMLEQFVAHEQHEQEFVSEYGNIVKRLDNPLVKFLLQLIISDEEKHHALVRTIASGFRKDLEWLKEGADMPRLGSVSQEQKDALLSLTANFIKAEEETISQFEGLMKQSEGYRKGLPTLLIKTIIHDSEKHLMILNYIDERLREA